MNNTIKLLVNLKKDRKRLDVFLSEEIKDYTRSYIKKLIEKKCVKLNNIIVTSSSIKLKTNDKVSLKIVEPKKNELIPKNIKLETIYEDKDILVDGEESILLFNFTCLLSINFFKKDLV